MTGELIASHVAGGPAEWVPPAAVLWDMDGTLVDSEKLWDVALFEAARRLGGTLSAEARAAMVGTHTGTTLRVLFDDLGIEPTDALWEDTDRWVVERMRELFAGPLSWRPGAREALDAVAAAGIPSALVTSTGRSLTELALRTIGRERFAATVCGDEVGGRTKPDPEPYLRAARLLGVPAADTWAVEDSPAGVASAAAAGCAVLVVPHAVPVESGDRRVFRPSLAGLRVTEFALPSGPAGPLGERVDRGGGEVSSDGAAV